MVRRVQRLSARITAESLFTFPPDDRQSEIAQPSVSILINQHVERLQISVDHSTAVHERDRASDLTGQLEQLSEREHHGRISVEVIRQCAMWAVLHHQTQRR
jgi:hypothetical protein